MINTDIAVIGAGSWGTALALHLSKKFKKKENKKNNFIDGEYEDIENDDDRKI